MSFFSRVLGRKHADSGSVAFDDEQVVRTLEDGSREVIRWDSLREVSVGTTGEEPALDNMYWRLEGESAACTVLSNTAGLNELLARLRHLPGFNNQAVIQAMSTMGKAEFACWTPEGETEILPEAAPPDMDARAAHFLESYSSEEGFDGGLAFVTALQQAGLDYSMESLDRMDALLDQIRQKARPTLEGFSEVPAQMNFCLVLAFYMGSLIARHAQVPIQWYGYREAVQELPPDFGLPDVFFSRVVAIVGGTVCLPLRVIEDKLFKAGERQTCRQYVLKFLQKLEAGTPKDEDAWSARYLDSFMAGQEPAGGLAFGSELRQAELDFSMESLDRIDSLLLLIRNQGPPPYEEFVMQQETVNFLLLLGYYLAGTVARTGGLPLKWLDYEETRSLIDGIAFQFETSRSCVLEDRIYFPLGVLTEILFAGQPRRTCHGFGLGILSIGGMTPASMTGPSAA